MRNMGSFLANDSEKILKDAASMKEMKLADNIKFVKRRDSDPDLSHNPGDQAARADSRVLPVER